MSDRDTSASGDSLLVKVDRGLKQQLRREAARQGTTMSRLTRQVLRNYLDEAEEAAERESSFGDWLDRARGSATTGMTTDEIMALTRGE